MPPLSRQRTLESIHSWWSDSNPTGPTIDLHAASKPLMRFMYHRQVLAFIQRNHSTPLSNEIMEIYESYLAFKYVSQSTKTAIVQELCERASSSEGDLRVLIESVVFTRFIPPGPVVNFHEASSPLMKSLYDQLALGFIKKNRDIPLCREIVEIHCTYLAFEYVSSPTKTVILMELGDRAWVSENDSRALVDPVVFHEFTQLLESPDRQIRLSMCRMVKCVARHASVLDVNPCVQLVYLLRDADACIVEYAIRELYRIAKRPDGSQAVVDAKMLDHATELLKSPNPRTRQLTCQTLGQLTRQESTAAAVSASNCCIQLVSLLRDENAVVIMNAIYTVSHLAYWPEGAQAVLGARALKHVMQLFDSPNSHVRYWTCELVENMTSHESTMLAVLDADPCPWLISSLQDTWSRVCESAVFALANISGATDGIAAIVDTGILEHVSDLMQSRNRMVQLRTCILLTNLARYEPVRTGVSPQNYLIDCRMFSKERRNSMAATEFQADVLHATSLASSGD